MTAALLTLAEISLAQGLAMVSPGPAFLLVSRTAASRPRPTAFATAMGVATAAALWAVAATAGVAGLLARFPVLYAAIQLIGAVYLIALGLAAWRDDPSAEMRATAPDVAGGQAFRRGLWLSLSNPKIVFFYGGIFVTLLPAQAPLWLRGAALALVVTQEFLWYSAVATVFSRSAVQALYGRLRHRIERVMGAVFIALGARIAALAHF
ncbi:LysE family transporter [Acidisoma sp. 7E03]